MCPAAAEDEPPYAWVVVGAAFTALAVIFGVAYAFAAFFAPFEAAVKRLGYDEHFFQTTCDVDDDHVPFLEAGLPSIDLIQFDDNPHWHRNSDTLEHVSPRSLGIVGRVVLAALPAIAERVLQK